MNIALIGSTGFIGSRILSEAQRRGHDVTTIARDRADALRSSELAPLIRAHDAVISAYGNHGQPELVVDAARSLIEAVKNAGVKRLVVVGGAGSLEVGDGTKLMDAPDFPREYLREARAQAQALEVFRSENSVDWTYVSPAADIESGQRTARFRTGDSLITDESGRSRISVEDFAVALIDEVERPQHVRRRFTVGY